MSKLTLPTLIIAPWILMLLFAGLWWTILGAAAVFGGAALLSGRTSRA